MIKMKTKLTIITPTYNRGEFLLNIAECLNNQTCKNFQWLIIDDGSTDQTKMIVNQIINDGYEFEYYYKENGGKHTALNFAQKYVKGEFSCILDSDDILIPEAVEEIVKIIEKYKSYDKIACFSFLRGNKVDRHPLNIFPKEELISNHISFRINLNIGGDCFEIFKSNILKEIPFPQFKNEKFMSEGYFWVNLAKNYDTVYINKMIYLCEYLNGGLTNKGRTLRLKSPLGGMENSNAYLQKMRVNLSIVVLIKEVLLYIVYGKFANKDYKYIVNNSNRKFLTIVLYPLGKILYIYWKNKYIKK